MTGEEWLRMINQLADKSQAGRLRWTAVHGGRVADVSSGFRVTLTYDLMRKQGQPQPVPGTLRLRVTGRAGELLAEVTEESLRQACGDAGLLALRRLGQVLVAEPPRQSLDEFRDALSEL